jgi:hypothetical protein
VGCRPVEERYSSRAKRVKTFSECNLHDLQRADATTCREPLASRNQAGCVTHFKQQRVGLPERHTFVGTPVWSGGTYGGKGLSAGDDE